MVKRRKIALIYEYNENWIGGTYYIQNLISALNTLPDFKMPAIIIFTNEKKHFDDLAAVTRYPFLYYRAFEKKLNIFQRAVNKTGRTILGKNIFSLVHGDVDLVFPYSYNKFLTQIKNKLYWIPDFQEHYLPEFFSEKEIYDRKGYQRNIVNEAKFIVFSSQSAQKDFNEIYPHHSLTEFVLPFAVSHQVEKYHPDIYKQYNIPQSYFICSNQFWKHKNQSVVLEAVAFLKARGISVFVAFTGKEHDYRNPDYFDNLKQKVLDLGIGRNIAFLGFISRTDQINLMKYAKGVIQPSLFEGWSTVVEDAKALNAHIVASDISVHQEQLMHYNSKQFFCANDIQQLADCLNEVPAKVNFCYDYKKQIQAFGNKFQEIYERVITN